MEVTGIFLLLTVLATPNPRFLARSADVDMRNRWNARLGQQPPLHRSCPPVLGGGSCEGEHGPDGREPGKGLQSRELFPWLMANPPAHQNHSPVLLPGKASA